MDQTIETTDLERVAREADIDLTLSVRSESPEYSESAVAGGSYLAAVAFVLRNLFSVDVIRGDTPPDSPLAFVASLEEPIAGLLGFATAAEIPHQLCRTIGADPREIIAREPKIANGYVVMRECLGAIAGIALRALRDGERAGWWTITPEGYDTASTLAKIVQTPLVEKDGRLVGYTGNAEAATSELGRLGDFLRNDPTIKPVLTNEQIVNAAIGKIGPYPTLTDSPFVSDPETASEAMARLANYGIDHVPGEPSRDEGVVDTVIRLIQERA